MSRPVFVLGKQRSGTTWLANMLSEHPQVCSVRHPQHHGVHESIFFSHVANRYGDLRDPTNFMEFASVFTNSDYYRLLGLPSSRLFDLCPSDAATVFRTIMDDFAESQGASIWLEKSPDHTLLVNELAAYYPDALFIAVVRDPEESTASLLTHTHAADTSSDALSLKVAALVVQSGLGHSLYRRTIKTFGRQLGRILVVDYAELLAQREATAHTLCAFLRLPFDEALLRDSFQPNTSFPRAAQHTGRTLPAPYRRLLRFAVTVGNVMPLAALRGMFQLARRRGGREPLPNWFFRLVREAARSAG